MNYNIKKAYSTDFLDLYNCDCMELLRETPDEYYDLSLVDPPYGINVNHNMGRRRQDKKSSYKPAVWDNEPPTKEYFQELFRVSKNQIIWGANHFISRMPFDSSCWLMWDKKFSNEVTFAQFELAWTSFKTTCKKFDKFPNGSEVRTHPTQKPSELYSWILRNYAKPNDKILDTHGGSLSIALAVHKANQLDKMNLHLTACEIDAEYVEQSIKRIINTTRQGVIGF